MTRKHLHSIIIHESQFFSGLVENYCGKAEKILILWKREDVQRNIFNNFGSNLYFKPKCNYAGKLVASLESTRTLDSSVECHTNRNVTIALNLLPKCLNTLNNIS